MRRILTLIPLFMLVFLISCSKERFNGSLSLSFYPIANSLKSDSFYWYLYPAENYKNIPYLEKGYLGDLKTDGNGRVSLIIKNLKPDNYVFTYHYNETIKAFTVQALSGQRKRYVLQN
ncbi:hypothetical protein [Siphonobacter sp. BAB-5385]|uniref:hypothetical protein n=1 Tax=Siphonobacter sp. BAB-5385 TaxID=1864822 RepID=UPI0011404BFA|nr:hypothetical protein [Siphonobacter sp. BAB-5385]